MNVDNLAYRSQVFIKPNILFSSFICYILNCTAIFIYIIHDEMYPACVRVDWQAGS